MANGDPTSYGARTCRCAQHGPILGAVTFSGCVLETQADAEAEADRLFRLFARPLKKASPEMVEHVRRAVDDYVSSLGEVEGDAATVVELVQRGDSWHISIRAGKMYHETAEGSLADAFEAVERVLGEDPEAKYRREHREMLSGMKAASARAFAPFWAQPATEPGQSVDSCAEVPTVRHDEIRNLGYREGYQAARIAGDDPSLFRRGWFAGRASALEDLPPCRIDDPEALAKLTPSRVRAYLKGKGWTTSRFSVGEPWFESPPRANGFKCLLQPGNHSRADTLDAISRHESRSAAAVYLDILAAEPGEGQS